MSGPRNLTTNYITAWCEEWEIAESDQQLLLQRYAEGDDAWELIDFMCDLARERRIELFRAGKLVSLEEFLNDPRKWIRNHGET